MTSTLTGFSTATGWAMGWVYAAGLVFALSAALFHAIKLARLLAGRLADDGYPSASHALCSGGIEMVNLLLAAFLTAPPPGTAPSANR